MKWGGSRAWASLGWTPGVPRGWAEAAQGPECFLHTLPRSSPPAENTFPPQKIKAWEGSILPRLWTTPRVIQGFSALASWGTSHAYSVWGSSANDWTLKMSHPKQNLIFEQVEALEYQVLTWKCIMESVFLNTFGKAKSVALQFFCLPQVSQYKSFGMFWSWTLGTQFTWLHIERVVLFWE